MLALLRKVIRRLAVRAVELVLPAQADQLAGKLEDRLTLRSLGRQLTVLQREQRAILSQLTLPPVELWGAGVKARDLHEPPIGVFRCSTVCRQEHFEHPAHSYWAHRMGVGNAFHRKAWEATFITQVLFERNMLNKGSGLGFAVGQELLPAFFASQGNAVVATDMAVENAQKAGWLDTGQHSDGKERLLRGSCPPDLFDALVEYRTVDMNHIPMDLVGFDFCWSACALEHLGSIRAGVEFIERSMECLRPGGFAVHTTEFNQSSNSDTLETGSTVLFRRRDLEELVARLTALGHIVGPLDLDPGAQALDRYVDLPPYRVTPHLKLAIQGYVCTSVGLIIQRNPTA